MALPLAFVRRHRGAFVIAAAALLCCVTLGVWLGVRAAASPVTPLQTLFLDYQDYLLARPGVVSVGIGELNGHSFIQVYVRRLTPQVVAAVPHRLGGWPVSIKAVKVRTPHPTKPSASPSPVSTPSRASQMAVDARGKVTAVILLTHPRSDQPLGWLLVDSTDAKGRHVRPVSIAITPETDFFQLKGEDLLVLPAETFGRGLRGRAIEASLRPATPTADLAQVTALAVVLVD
jgi:hypothetical protein